MRLLVTSILDLSRTAHNPLHQFLRHLSRNHEITLLSLADWWKADTLNTELYSKDFKDLLNSINIKYVTERKLSPVLQELSSVLLVGRLLDRTECWRFNAHFSYSGLLYSYLVSQRMAAAGVPTVYHVGDDVPAMVREAPQIHPWLRAPGGWAASKVMQKNIKNAARVTFITSALRNAYRTQPDKCEVLPNGVDTKLFSNTFNGSLRGRLNIGADDFVLGYVGVLREWVELEPIFIAARKLAGSVKGLKVLVVGEEGGLKDKVALAERHSVRDMVVFTGTVPYLQVPEYISCMDVCLIPFKRSIVTDNALPMKLFEYMACGKPVVSTRLAGVVEVAGDRVLYASDSEELEARIQELHRDAGLRQRFGSEGRRLAAEGYSWDKACRRLEDILLETVSNGKSRQDRDT